MLRRVYAGPIAEGSPGRRVRPADRRAGQGQRQRVPRHQDLVHQRDRRRVRGRRRRRHGPGRRPRPRRPHRPSVPRRRSRLRRRLPAQGHPRAHAPRQRARRLPGRPRCSSRSTRSTWASARAVIDLAIEACGGSVLNRRIGVLGAAFKPHTDDVRDSPALNVAAALHLRGAQVTVYDPEAGDTARAMFPTLGLRDQRRGGRRGHRRGAACSPSGTSSSRPSPPASPG